MLTARIVASAAAALALAPCSAFAQEPAQAQTDSSAQAQSDDATSNAEASKPSSTVVAAEPADFRVGMEVRDPSGGMVGAIESVDGEGAVVNTGERRAKLPFASFGKNDQGLVISLSRAELEAAAAAQAGG